MKDRDLVFHKKWLGLAQPIEGLVFSVPVLAGAQIAPEERPQLSAAFESHVDPDTPRIRSLAAFFRDFLGYAQPGMLVPRTALPPDSGRASGVRQAVAAEFACTSRWSDAGEDDCAELRFATTEGEELLRAYKTPSLRNVAERAPYMHAGQLATLADVIRHYSTAPAAPFGHSELRPLRLSPVEQRQLEAFLRTLSGPLQAPEGFLAPPKR